MGASFETVCDRARWHRRQAIQRAAARTSRKVPRVSRAPIGRRAGSTTGRCELRGVEIAPAEGLEWLTVPLPQRHAEPPSMPRPLPGSAAQVRPPGVSSSAQRRRPSARARTRCTDRRSRDAMVSSTDGSLRGRAECLVRCGQCSARCRCATCSSSTGRPPAHTAQHSAATPPATSRPPAPATGPVRARVVKLCVSWLRQRGRRQIGRVPAGSAQSELVQRERR